MSKRGKVMYVATGEHRNGPVRLVHSTTFPHTFAVVDPREATLGYDPVGRAAFKTRGACEEAARVAAANCASIGEPVTEVLVFAVPISR